VLYANALAKRAVVMVGCKTFGTEVQVESVNVGILAARTSIHEFTVDNPAGFDGNFLHLAEGVLDTNIWSLWASHVELQELSLQTLNVVLQQTWHNMTSAPNFVPILHNLQTTSHRKSSMEPPGFLGGKISARRYTVDKLEMKDLTVAMDMRINALDLQSPPISFKIHRIVINNVGKWQNGVTLEELMTIVVNAVVSAAIEAAPSNMGTEVLDAIKGSVTGFQSLDFDSLRLDLGEGLKEFSKLIDRVSQNSRTDAVAQQNGVRDSQMPLSTLQSAEATADDMEMQMAQAMSNSSTAWGNALGSGQDGAQAITNAANSTVNAFTSALDAAQQEAQDDGDFGQVIANALNATQQVLGYTVSTTSAAPSGQSMTVANSDVSSTAASQALWGTTVAPVAQTSTLPGTTAR